MRLIHLTDPHLSSLEGQSLFTVNGKRRSGFLSWNYRRRFIYQRETLDLLTETIRQEAADHLILSGDLVQIGLEKEIHDVSAWLADLAPAEKIFFVPGNHDVYARDSWAALRRHWNFVLPAPAGDTPDTSTSPYPFTRDLGGIRLIGASSACVTPVFLSRGAMGRDQFDRLTASLAEARELGFMPCLAIHHPPLPHMSPWMKALKEVHALKALLQTQQPALVWCGHQHSNIEETVDATRVFCTASASRIKRSSFRIFDIDNATQAGQRRWTIRMRLKSIDEDGTGFVLADEKRWSFTL